MFDLIIVTGLYTLMAYDLNRAQEALKRIDKEFRKDGELLGTLNFAHPLKSTYLKLEKEFNENSGFTEIFISEIDEDHNVLFEKTHRISSRDFVRFISAYEI